jgi:uncharacterized protein (TIGR03067 family)
VDDQAVVEKELKKFQGSWTFESVEAGGKEVPAADFKGITVTWVVCRKEITLAPHGCPWAAGAVVERRPGGRAFRVDLQSENKGSPWV